MKRRVNSMTAGLAVGITAATVLACAAGAYLYSLRHFETLIETARGTARSQAELIRAALEHEMMEQDRTLIARMIENFGREPGVKNVMLLDRQGTARFASVPLQAADELRLDGPTCQACHRLPPAQRMSSRVIDAAGGTILRTVVPVPNRPECRGCHDPTHKINGIIIFDMDAGAIRTAATRDLRWMVAVSAALALLLAGAIAIIVRIVVIRRLQKFETTARLIAGGDLNRRVPAAGTDTISWLAREFNSMADAVTGLVGQVRDQRERLETVINSIDDGIVVLDRERRVVAANDAFLKRTGRVRDGVLGCSCGSGEPGMCNVTDCPTLACLQTGERQVRICERRLPDGTVAWEEVHASPVVNADGTSVQVVEVWRDISERRAAEARLAESHRLASLGMLASGFSHELNTPLATVLTCVEGIGRELRNAAAGPDYVRIGESTAIAREQILRCRAVTQHFLRMSRGQASPDGLVDMQACAAAVVRLIDPTAREHGVSVTLRAGDGDLRVVANEAELQQALMNLLLNAVQACRPGGTVRVLLERAHADLRIRVADTGSGIEPERQPRIFDPFCSFRAGGTGLGLFLSLTFVRRAGGDIHVESTPGHGSTFDIVLPAASAAAVAGPAA
jgi:PAS domain S-box-containing protein